MKWRFNWNVLIPDLRFDIFGSNGITKRKTTMIFFSSGEELLCPGVLVSLSVKSSMKNEESKDISMFDCK